MQTGLAGSSVVHDRSLTGGVEAPMTDGSAVALVGQKVGKAAASTDWSKKTGARSSHLRATAEVETGNKEEVKSSSASPRKRRSARRLPASDLVMPTSPTAGGSSDERRISGTKKGGVSCASVSFDSSMSLEERVKKLMNTLTNQKKKLTDFRKTLVLIKELLKTTDDMGIFDVVIGYPITNHREAATLKALCLSKLR